MVFYWWMPQMHSMHWTGKRLYRMLEYFDQGAHDFFPTYRGYVPLIVGGTTELRFSSKGTTQGDPLAMLFYGVSLIPLIESLKDRDKYLQTWYADDSGALGPLENLVEWLSSLTENGPKYGYYSEPSKSYLVVHSNFVEKGHQLFDWFGIRIVEGRRYLGGFIGSDEGKIRFTLKKVQEWLDCLGELSKVAEKEPQAALVGLTISLQCDWNFVQRVVKNTSQLFAPLEKMLEENFLPSLQVTSSVTHSDRVLYSLPVKRGGLGVLNRIFHFTWSNRLSREFDPSPRWFRPNSTQNKDEISKKKPRGETKCCR